MIAYFDTSALVKLVVSEADSELARQCFESASLVLTHQIAYVEAHSAISRIECTGALIADLVSRIRAQFETCWSAFSVTTVDQELIYSAAHLTRRFPLKGYDSVHLAAADRCQRQNGMRSLTFACFDDRLNKAAAELGMQLMRGA